VSDRYRELHTKIVEDGYKWVEYYYALDGKCYCGHSPIHHHFILRNPSGNEITLGSTCITRNENYNHLFKDKNAWNNLKRRISAFGELQKLIRDTPEWRDQKWTLKRLDDTMRVQKQKYQDGKLMNKTRTMNMMKELEAYEWATGGISFLQSITEQAKTGYSLSDRQVSAFENIRDKFNDKESITTDEVMIRYADWKSKPHYEDDFKLLSDYIRMWEGDRNKVYKLKPKSAFNDNDIDIADRLLHKYRRQLGEMYQLELDKVEQFGDNPFSNAYIGAYERVKGGKIIG